MLAFLIVAGISAGALVTAILLSHRRNPIVALVGGAFIGFSLWAVASIGLLFWFANSG